MDNKLYRVSDLGITTRSPKTTKERDDLLDSGPFFETFNDAVSFAIESLTKRIIDLESELKKLKEKKK